MLILISPAKKLQITKTKRSDLTTLEFPDESKELISELRKFKPEKLSILMNISPKLAELNFERYLKWNFPFNNEEANAALFMFIGDVYRGIQTEDFSEDDIVFVQNHLRILSGLYGIIKPMDKIMPYRLEMGTKLKTEKGKSLYEFWNVKITERINNHLNKQNDKVLINLASNEYFKAVKASKIKGKILTPVFKESKGDEFKVIGVHAKRARGLMCRYIIKNKLKNPEDLLGFNSENYSYNHKLSSDSSYVFTR